MIAGFSTGELVAYRYEIGRQLWSDALARTSLATSVGVLTDIDADPIIDRGRAVVTGALDDLREQFRRIQLVFDGEAPDHSFRAPGVVRVKRQGRVMTVLSSAGVEGVFDEARTLNAVSVDSVAVTLKDIFLETVVGEE